MMKPHAGKLYKRNTMKMTSPYIKRAMKDALSDLNIDSDHIDVELEDNVQYIHSGTSELEVSAIIIH